ncbi:hypothetical protein CAPTEDRAFT_77592, partial [Capitella teleta]
CPEKCTCKGMVAVCVGLGFENIPALPASTKVLYMNYNNVRSQFFTTVPYDLLVLDMTNNKLTFLEQASFGSCQHLWDLRLSKNEISHFVGRVFNRCSNLRSLDLSHNPISALSTELISGLTSL